MFDKQLLIDTLVNEGAVIHRDVKLSSGKQSNFYYDLRGALLDPSILSWISGEITDMIFEKDWDNIKSIGGLETSAIPLVIGLVNDFESYSKGQVNGFYIRKQPKHYGISEMIVGKIVSPVLLVDDVLTTGASIKKAIETVEMHSHKVKGVITIIDREDDASKELKKRVKCYSLLKHSDFENH
jgi:orotate phosphoribosyltransferase